MQATLAQLCQALREVGMTPELHGDPNCVIQSVATLEEAGPGQVSFLSNPKYEKMLTETKASAIVLKPDIAAPDHLNLIRIADPYAAITVLIVKIHGYRQHRRAAPCSACTHIDPSARIGENATIHPGATIDENVVIGKNAVIYPGCYVGPRCRIGDNVLLFPNVVLYDDSVLGDRVTIHSGSVIGEDGLGYAPVGDKWVKIPQIGHVEVGDDVEIGSNCSIDRATLGKTVIGKGTKFSNLIAIGHGTQIDENCLFVAQVGLAGSVSVGKNVTMAGQVGVVGHIRIGDKATIGAKAGVTNNVPDGETMLGAPAIPITEMKRQVIHLQRLPELKQQVKQLQKQLAELEKRLSGEPGTVAR
jgi:UDP-3-O-[3-hydroxymyristoyl] glucosamine N-acyltransferase